MAKIIAVYNIKGGVGKTTSAVNLAYFAAKSGYKTLLWDMDHQGAAGFFLANESKLKGGLNAMMKDIELKGDKKKLHERVVETDYENLHLLPSDISLRLIDIKVAEARGSMAVVGKLLAPLADEYDYIFVDCAPGLTVANESLMHCADSVITPVIPTVLSIRMLEQLNEYINNEVRKKGKNGKKPAKPKLRAFFTMLDARKVMHKNIYEQFCVSKKTVVFPTAIPYQSITEKMAVEQKPLAEFAASSASAQAYEELFNSIKRMR